MYRRHAISRPALVHLRTFSEFTFLLLATCFLEFLRFLIHFFDCLACFPLFVLAGLDTHSQTLTEAVLCRATDLAFSIRPISGSGGDLVPRQQALAQFRCWWEVILTCPGVAHQSGPLRAPFPVFGSRLHLPATPHPDLSQGA